ncbi:MAG: hypothetical protein SH859_07825 [Hyphomicrobium aestuarii]|nr:hypothetical protein [Hyphomicrobium aestuarii]
MRTTLDIDEDVLAALKERAGGQGTTAGRLASDLLRQALSGQSCAQAPPGFSEEQAKFEPVSFEDQWVVLKSRGGLVTTDLVRRLEDEMDAEDLSFARAPRRQHSDRVDR